MLGQPKSDAFLYYQTKDRSGENNPMYGKIKSEETLKKVRKIIFVYDVTKNYELIGIYLTVMCTRIFKLCNNTLKKIIDNK